jgi:hypothetical protein
MDSEDTGFDDMPTIEFGDEPTLVGFDKVPTVVQQRPIGGARAEAGPPALPFQLMRKKGGPSNEWMASLPTPARRVLERAKRPAQSWPRAPRLPGAVAVPVVDPFDDGDTEVN